MEKFS